MNPARINGNCCLSLLAYTDPNIRELIHCIIEAGVSSWHRDGQNTYPCWKQKNKGIVNKCYM
jgi:hypothetical protein